MLALIDEVNGPNLWRVLQPITALEKAGYACGWDFKSADLLGLVAPHVDGYLLPRISWPPSHRRTAEAWFQSIRKQGKFAVYDMDDDVLTSQETHRRVDLDWMEGKTLEQLEAERFERIWAMQQCDGVTVTTQRLATIARQFTQKPVIVVPNAIDVPWFRGIVNATKREIPGLTIGWAGGRRHDRDVEQMAEAWGRIARYSGGGIQFVVQGWVPPIILERVPSDRLTVLPWMKAETYPSGIAQIDIGCCAVADTPFNRAKSNIKAMEFAVAGAAVVASPTLYSGIVEDGKSGYIAETADEWGAALGKLVRSNPERQMMARRLLRTVEKHHSLAGNLWRWPAAWATISASAQMDRIINGTGAPAQLTGILRG
jgi:glycosyltransferase involved in cell wall biosynthesis